MTEPTRRRPAAGAALLRGDVTDAITTAAVDELAETGYARMSMEAVARRAGVGKAAIYRRWPSKQAMVERLVGDLAWNVVPVPDTGALRDDVHDFIEHAAAFRRDSRAARIIADLSAEAGRNRQLAQAFYAALVEPRRVAGATMLRKAIDRGELPGDLDTGLALDCLVALAYSRPHKLTASGELNDHHPRERLLEVVLAALAACRR